MNSKKRGVIIQARMGSTRLPGKVLKELDKNETVLDLLIKRLKLSKDIDQIIIATTPDEKNNKIIELAKSYEIDFFVGSEVNVLERYYFAAKKFDIDIIIRITSDCPFIDPKVVDDMIVLYQKSNFDYIKNIDDNTNFPRGLDIEIFSFEVLDRVYSLAKTKQEKEHVTYYIYTHPNIFTISTYNLKDLKKIDGLRLTIDEIDDLVMCRKVYKKLKENGKGIDFSIFDIIEIIEKYPELIKINLHVQQKKK